MTSTFSPYLPRLAAEWELDSPGARWRRIEATCCFVDISGFTALSERLARRGRIGAEELTEVLDHVFSRMLTVAWEKGGSLLKFGGDALLIMFSDAEHPVLAAEAAIAMRAALREARSVPTSVGRVNLRMSVGVHTGDFHFFRVGGLHRELLVVGRAATATTLMEQTADPGEIVVSATTAARLPRRMVGAPKDLGYLLRGRTVVSGGPGVPSARAVADRDLELGVPIALRDRLRAGSAESEHRVASVGFLKFQGVDDYLATNGEEATADALEEIVSRAQAAAEAEAVTILASDIDANAGKLILVSGVPTARDDDEGRMLRTAHAIVDRAYAIAVKIGVNRGHVFAGDIGTEFRRTFTVMGDTVNLAARLMAAAAPGEVYATAEILGRSRTLFETRALEPFFVKGKAEPVQAYSVGDATGIQHTEGSALPFVGRDAQITTMRSAYAAAVAGNGSVVEIEGDRGSGKSRLLGEFLTPDSRMLFVQCEAYAASTAFLPLRAPLRTAFGIDGMEPAEAAAHLAARIGERLPEKSALVPLLAPLLEVDLEQSPESAAIAPEFRRDRLADLVVDLLDADPRPLVIVVDDAQWLDDASAGLVERMFEAARSRPWLAITARRPSESGFRPNADIAMVLDPIDDATARNLIDDITGGAPLRPQERDRLVARAAGNPLFMGELLRHGRSTGFDALPETLDAVATREIDALAPGARRKIRYASVLGRVFDPALLVELLGIDALEPGELEALSSYLLPVDGRLQFRHALLQEAAYESLPFRTRIELHRRAGEAILRRPSADADADEALLSLHFFLAQDWERAWKVCGQAARRSVESFAPAEAAIHIERAVTAARRLGDVSDEEVADLLIELGEALVTLGRNDHADDAYRRAARAANAQPIERARILDRRAYVRGECQGRLTTGIRHVRAGVALLDELVAVEPGSEALVASTRAQLHAREASFRLMQGRHRESERLCRQVIADAEAAGELQALAKALIVLDVNLLETGRPDEATHMLRALRVYEDLGDRPRIADTLNNLGGVAFLKSRWPEAADSFLRAAEAATTTGDLATAALAQYNLGELRVYQGRLEDAEAMLVPAIRTLESYGLVITAAQAKMQLGRARALQGDAGTGVELLEAAMETVDAARALVLSIEARTHLAEMHTVTEQFDRARVAIEEARGLARDLGDVPVTVALDRVAATLAATTGDPDAEEQLAHASVRARTHRSQYDTLLLLEIARRRGTSGADSEAAEIERAELVSELGLVQFVTLGTVPSSDT